MAGSRHTALVTSEGHVWTMGHSDSKGGGGHGSLPMHSSGHLGREGGPAPGRVTEGLSVGGAPAGQLLLQSRAGILGHAEIGVINMHMNDKIDN